MRATLIFVYTIEDVNRVVSPSIYFNILVDKKADEKANENSLESQREN